MKHSEARVYALVAGKVIATLREHRGWNQSQLSRLTGITQSTLSRIERGQVLPDIYMFRVTARAFGLTVGQLSKQIELAFIRTEQAARQAAPQSTKNQDTPWWEAALVVAGVVGLAGLVAFAVSTVVDEESGK